MNSSHRITIWKFLAFICGCVGIAFSAFLFYLWQYDNHVFYMYKIEPLIFYITSAINFIASVIWFSGICTVNEIVNFFLYDSKILVSETDFDASKNMKNLKIQCLSSLG